MASNMTYNIRIDSDTRKKAEVLYRSMSMSLSAAINIFLTQSIVQGRLPIAEIVAPADAEDISKEALL